MGSNRDQAQERFIRAVVDCADRERMNQGFRGYLREGIEGALPAFVAALAAESVTEEMVQAGGLIISSDYVPNTRAECFAQARRVLEAAFASALARQEGGSDGR